MTQDLESFIALAKRGELPNCSSAEYGAGLLADAVLEHVFDFDEHALRGFVTFIGITKVTPAKAAKLLD